jgi:GNAT superfamily N-acetyltransferase
MPSLEFATEEQIAAVHRESHALWGAGLERSAYDGMWAELRATAWGARHLSHRVFLGEDGAILSSAKVYRPVLRVGDVAARCSAVGALFTPRRRRGRGHGRALLAALVDEARRRGDPVVLLFSDIGTPYYAELGFRALPAEEASGSLRDASRRRPAGIELRPMTRDDLDEVVRCDRAASAARPVAIVRDRDHWDFLMTRAGSFFARLDGSDLSRRYRVALRDGRVAGYLVSAEGEGEWNLREAAAADGKPETLRAILDLGAADARERGMVGVYGWLPRETGELVPEWRLRFEPRRRAIPMVLPLAHAAALDGGSFFFPYLDQF